MIDPQLEVGALETLDGDGNPVAAPGEEELYRSSIKQSFASAGEVDEELPPPATVDLSTLEGVDGDALGADSGGDPLAYEQTIGARPSQAKLVGAAGLYRVADLSETLTPEDVEQMLLTQVPHPLVADLHSRLGSEDSDIQAITQKMLLTNPRLSVEDKLDTIRLMNGDTSPDINIVQRAVATNAAEATYMMDDEEDDADWRETSLEAAEDVPKALAPYESRVGKDDAQRASVWSELDQLYKESDEKESFLDYVEMVTPVGSLPTLNATVQRIKSDLGMDSGTDMAISYGSVGNAMMELRQMIRQAGPDQKADIARVVLANLKQDTGLFQDSNDLVVMQVIDNLFSKEMSGQDSYAVDAPLAAGEQTALVDRLNELNTELQKGAVPNRAEIEHERAQIMKRLGGISGATVLDNVFNLLDLVGLGQTAKTTLRFGTKWMPNAWRGMFKASPRLASRRMADAVERPEIAEQMGLSQADAINTGLPNAGVIERGANVLGELAQRQQDALEMVLRQAQPVNMTLAERGAALAELQDEVGALVQKKLARGHVNMHTITPRADESGADIVAIFGKTKDRGYATLAGARKAKKDMVEEVFGKDAPTEVVRFNYGSNEFEVVDDAVGAMKGEFFVRAADSRSYASTKNTWGKLNLGDDTVADLALGAGVSTWTRALNIFDPITQGWISSRARAAKGAEGLGQGLMKPIADMPFEKKQLLSELVKKNEGKLLSDHDIRLAGGDDQVVTAYNTFRTVDDATYALVDYDLRNQYMREGLKDVVVGGQRAGWAKPVERLRSSTLGDTKVFDPETGLHSKLTQADIDAMYASGESLGRLKFPIDGANGRATHIKLSGKTTRVLPIPQRGVLPRIEGHYPHITQGNYVVSGITKNGERVALKMAATQSDAVDYVTRRKALMASRSGKGRSTNFTDIVWELDHSLQNRASWGAKLDEVFTNNGGVLYGQRNGGQLGNLSKDFGAINVDPIQALLRGFGVATQHVTKGELVATMRQRLYNFLRSPENRNLFVDPTTSAQNLGVKNVNPSHSNVKARNTAMAYAKQIELLESAPDAWREATKSVYNQMAYQAFRLTQVPFISRSRVLKGTARKVEQLAAQGAKRGDNVVNAFMAAAHARYIAVMAPKQFVLQAAQSTMAIGLSSVQDFAKAWRQFGGISGATLMRMKSLHGGVSGLDSAQLADFAQKTAKVFGMEADEMVKIVDTLVDSGLLDAVGHNSMIKEAIGEAAEKRMLQTASGTEGALGAAGRAASAASQIVKRPINALSRLGFQGGENINQIISFLSLYNADKAKGIANLASDVYKDKLIGRVSELTGNMVAEASPQYTRSYLKPFTQWLQFQHKMILLTLPEKLGGSNVLSGEEKIRTAFMQFLLYGSSGTATTTLLHKVVEEQLVEKWEAAHPGEDNELVNAWRSAPMKGVMDGFLMDYTANAVLKALYGDTDKEWKDFAWGKAFAPGAGSEFLAERLIAMGTGDVEGMMGVNGQDFSKLRQWLRRTRDVAQAQWKGFDDVPFDARAEQLMKQGGVIALPIYGKFLAAKWAMENDAKISAGGKVSEGFNNEIEAQLGLILGVDTKDRVEFYAARDRLEGDFQKGREGHVEEIANTYWEQLVKNATVFADKQTDEDLYDRMLTDYVNEQGLMLSVLDPRDKQAINEIISTKLQKLASGDGDTTELAFIKRITKKLEDGGYGADGPQIAVYLQSLDFAKKKPEMAVMIQQAVEAAMEDPQEQNMTTNEVAN